MNCVVSEHLRSYIHMNWVWYNHMQKETLNIHVLLQVSNTGWEWRSPPICSGQGVSHCSGFVRQRVV